MVVVARRLVAVAVVLLTGCATLAGDDDPQPLTISDTSDETVVTAVPFDTVNGVAEYKHQKQSGKAEWIACKPKSGAKASVIAMHEDRAGFDRARFCSGWIAQTFLTSGVAVATVNRPGYGSSTGIPDFSGPQSQAAFTAALKDIGAKAKLAQPISGAWGYGTGATSAALLSRGGSGLQFLILGGGVYDMEETLGVTQDSYLKKDIEAIKATGGNKAIEDRSIAYDVSGLPKRIIIYHGKNDVAVPASQAKAFADALESGEYKVTLQEIDGVAHDLQVKDHRKILLVLIHAAIGS